MWLVLCGGWLGFWEDGDVTGIIWVIGRYEAVSSNKKYGAEAKVSDGAVTWA